MYIFRKIVALCCAAITVTACSVEQENITTPDQQSVEVSFALPENVTRTSIAPDGTGTRWSIGDKIAVWAKDAEGNFTFSNTAFMLRNYSTEYTLAYFTGAIDAMDEGDYTYLISYPTPTSAEGDKATFTVPTLQSGEYDGKYDIMIGEPTANGALTPASLINLNTLMKHQMHAIKITVPEGRNIFGRRFTRLEITFPTPVVGDITLDITNPDAEPEYSNTSNIVVVENEKGFDEGDDIWIFVLPGTVDGDVSYKVYGSRRNSEVASYPLTRTMQRGHITPIKMATPVVYPLYTAVHLSISQNNLGEDFNYFDIYDSNSNHMGRFQRNAENKYTIDYEGEFDANTYDDSSWRIVFDSEHAIVETSLKLGDLTSYKEHSYGLTIPYLLNENFNSLSNYTDEATTGTKTLDIAGWTASRTNCKDGVIQLAVFYALIGRYQGRLDSAPISALKKSAKISVTFDANNNISRKVEVPLQFGWGTDPSAIQAGTAIENLVTTENLAKGANRTLTYTIDNFAAGGRLAWQTNVTSGYWATYNYLGIDNIKVQIAK